MDYAKRLRNNYLLPLVTVAVILRSEEGDAGFPDPEAAFGTRGFDVFLIFSCRFANDIVGPPVLFKLLSLGAAPTSLPPLLINAKASLAW